MREFAQTDLGWLWAAYKAGSFKVNGGMDQRAFATHIQPLLSGYENFIIEDDSRKFLNGKGPIAFISVTHDGWKYEPCIVFFKWATKKNMLRASVAFFHKTSLSSKIGVCVVRWKKSPLLDHMKKYGVLFPRGKIPCGMPDGDEYIYSVLGRKGSEAMNKVRQAPEMMAA